jgi:hypothetical protein
VDNKYVQITRSFTETKMAIEETFVNPKRYAEGRKAIVDQYVYYSDSQSGQRVAEWIANVAKSVTPGRPRGY